MTTFDERERAFETRFARETEYRFRVAARRNRLLGLWAAERLGKSGEDAKAYAREVVKADLDEAGQEEVLRKVAGDLGAEADEATIRAKMAELLSEAEAQVAGEG